ncbi:DNA methyltransferase [Mycobacterium phage JuliaChild]|nr:DNA methyltransferase [Mycobacterium phage JuliaChild]
MTRDELRESIPPAYTEFIGQHLMSYLVENQPGNSFGYPLDS